MRTDMSETPSIGNMVLLYELLVTG